MEWFCKALLTMVSVALVLGLARRWGGAVAGLVAGLPTTTAPALAWMASEHGAAFAAEAAASAVAAGSTLAAFALGYAHAARAGRPPCTALAWGGAAAVAMTGPALACAHALPAALALGTGSAWLVLLAWPAAAARRRTASVDAAMPLRHGNEHRWRGANLPAWLPAAYAGGISLGLAAAGPAIGSAFAGLLASLPVVSVSVAMAQHAAQGPDAARLFLRGAVTGLLGRSAFCAVFALTVSPLGTGAALAWGLAATAALHLAGLGWCRLSRTQAAARPTGWGPVGRT